VTGFSRLIRARSGQRLLLELQAVLRLPQAAVLVPIARF
jgi:hypothetical protein